jgi:hypothetical protein
MEHLTCVNKNLEILFIQKINSKKYISKSVSTNSLVTVKDLPNNPYLSSITGKYAFDLSKITNFKLYFWKSSDNTSKNDAVKFILDNYMTSPALDWSLYYQDRTLNALSQYTLLQNKKSSITTSYEESDIVCILADSKYFGGCYGPYWIYKYPTFVDNKIILFLSNTYTTIETIKQGGQLYHTLLHEFGHGFGLSHPHDDLFDSTVIPGLSNIQCDDSNETYSLLPNCYGASRKHQGLAGYANNSMFNTIMSYNYYDFFLPINLDLSTSKTGYAQTLMPLDACALRWMYNFTNISRDYVSKFGVKVINPAADEQKTKMIIGKNRKITFGSNCNDVNFYFSNNYFNFNNLEPIKYQYNRIIEKPYTFYPQDLYSTVATLNFKNTQSSTIFIEKNALKTNLTVNCLGNTVLNVYIIDLKCNYKISGTAYTNKNTRKKMIINNNSRAKINVFFNK